LSHDNICQEIPNNAIRLFDLNSVINDIISKYYADKSLEMGKLIGHYVKGKSNLMYVAASCNVGGIKNIILLEFKIRKGAINGNLLDYVFLAKPYKSFRIKKLDLESIRIYEIRDFMFKESSLVYSSNDIIVDINYNRHSIILQVFLQKYFRIYMIKQRNVSQHDKLFSLVYVIRERDKWDYKIFFGFIVSELSVVRKW
jgi:hypothetical protein